jgi:hypothetical protein
MADEKNYKSVPFIYNSHGLDSRHAPDRVPEGFYINNLNAFEREEGNLSSRYGTRIINRDPYGSGTSNFYFPSPVTSLARLLFQGQAYRYAGLQNGTLWRRVGNLQGPYSQLTLPFSVSLLSGQTFQSVVTSCYETSQAYLFIYDAYGSVKDNGILNPIQLIGIDPPENTANARPYSPLLTLIDNFSASNTYAASGFSGSWAYASVTDITALYLDTPTDFSQYTISGTAIAGGSVTATQTSYGSSYQTTIISGLPSTPTSPTASLTVTVPVVDTGIVGGTPAAGSFVVGNVALYYSVNGGVTWTVFGVDSGPMQDATGAYLFTIGSRTWVFSVTGMSNLDQFRIKAYVNVEVGDNIANTLTISGTSQVQSVSVSVPAAGVFGKVCNGILSVLNSGTPAYVPIDSVVSSNQVGDFYTDLVVTTSQPLSLTASNVAIYGSSNSLADGFYPSTITASNTVTVPFLSLTPISAQGGLLCGGLAQAADCILIDQYSTPYPTQMSALGFYQPLGTPPTSFPIGSWTGTVAANTTATVGVTAKFDLSVANQVTDSDLIVLTLQVGSPQNIANIRLQFDVNGSGYTSSYYYANIAPAYYQGNIANLDSAYQTTQNQILADALGLLTGQTESSTTAQLQPSNFSTGESAWVAVLIPRGNFLPVGSAGQSGLDWTNITGWQVQFETSTTGDSTVALNGLYLQWGYGPSSFGGIGYDYRYTYYNFATGTESSPSPEMQFNRQYGYLSSLAAPFYLRQAAQVSGYYSSDPQVTHLRMYRRGGIYASNWLLIDQVPNYYSGQGGQIYPFTYKDVVPDSSLAQAQPLVLDNDPPVTSSLVAPVLTTLALSTTSPGSSIYSTYAQQGVTVTDATAIFYLNQTVLVGNATNLEEVTVTAGRTGSFSAVLRLQHNAGEQVQANSIPRVACNLCCLINLPGGVTQVLLAGDPNNLARIYFSKPGQPENFGPEDYVDLPLSNDAVMGLINWRGTPIVGTLNTWYIFVGGAKPYLQPTGAAHGMASSSWTLVEGDISYLSQDGMRAFSGADGQYMTLPVEWMFRNSPKTIIPKLDPNEYASAVLCQYQNQTYMAFQSASNSLSTGNGLRYRLRWASAYKRFGIDDVPATAMLWEQDTNALLLGTQIGPASASNFAVVQDWIGDYDDGGWVGGSLVETPINLVVQTPYHDLGKPHFPKQWNMLEGDYDTQGQSIQTTLLFNTEPASSLVLPAATTSTRSKVQYQIPAVASASNPIASGVQAYAMSIQHQMAVTMAPTLFQEDIYAVVLADFRTSFDTYWQGNQGDLLGIQPKNGYFDYTATAQLTVSLYADGDDFAPYYIDDFTLIPQASRSVVRVQLPARKGRLWRVIVTSPQPFQLWAPARFEIKGLQEGSGYEERKFPVYE